MRTLQKLGGRARMARLLPSFERRLRLRRPALGRRGARIARLLPSFRRARGGVGGLRSRSQRLVQLFAPFGVALGFLGHVVGVRGARLGVARARDFRGFALGLDERPRRRRRRALTHR